MADQIEDDIERAAGIRVCRRDEAARIDVESDIPPMIDQRRQLEPHLAGDLRPAVQRFAGVAPGGERQVRPKSLVRSWGRPRSTSRDALVLAHDPENLQRGFRKAHATAQIGASGSCARARLAASENAGAALKRDRAVSEVDPLGAGATLRSLRVRGARLPADTASSAKTAADRRRTKSISPRSRSSRAPMRSAACRPRGRRENPSTGGTSARRLSRVLAPAAAMPVRSA